MGKYFGTDGIRGIANKELTATLAYKVGRALGAVLKNKRNKEIIIGRDTRKSGTMIESAISTGLAELGYNVKLAGIVPTPAIAYLTRTKNAVAGIVISASHNPFEYNGIKIFSETGYKLTDDEELEIEKLIESGVESEYNAEKENLGVILRDDNLKDEYFKYLLGMYDLSLKGMKISIDTGSGALYELAPKVLKELGAEVFSINTSFDGTDINKGTGSTNPEKISKLTVDSNSDIGFSFDGDGDRIIAVDENGIEVDGDHILSICGTYLKNHGKLKKDTVVGTVMTNMGLDLYFQDFGINVVKTKVGDRYILQEMLDNGYNFGGEQSGHIIFLDYNTTGDGLATAIHILKVLSESGKKFSEISRGMKNVPQVLVNAKVKKENKDIYMNDNDIRSKIEEIEKKFEGKGRVLIRPSGTEPLVRVMIEADSNDNIKDIANELATLIENKLYWWR